MNVQHTETMLSIDTPTNRRITVTRQYDTDGPTDLFLTIRALDGPRDQEDGSAHLTPQQAEPIAHALLGIDDHHDLDEYAARVFAKHRRDCHDGATDGDCAACSIAVGAGSAFTLSDVANLRARWANERQPYDRGGFLVSPRYNGQDKPRAPYVEQFAPEDDRHVTTGGKAPDWTIVHQTILRLARERDDALTRATRAEARLAAIDTVYAVTEEQIDTVDVMVHTTATVRDITREYRTEHRTVLPGETPERLRESIRFHLQSVADLEAIARAMEEG